MINWIRLFWYTVKGLFVTRLDESTTITTEPSGTNEVAIDHNKAAAYQLKRFLEIYSIENQDVIDYTNTHEDHHSGFAYLCDMTDSRSRDEEGDVRVSDVVGLIYEGDGKTPKNVAVVFDMNYEEYEEYKNKILPEAKNRAINFEEVEALMLEIRS